MRKILTPLLYLFLSLAAVLVLAFIALQLISDDQYRQWMMAAARSATGRELAIDGDFEVKIGARVSLQATDIRFANAEWGSRENMARVERLFVQVKLMPLFKGILDFSLEVDSPDILLETNEAGLTNWQLGAREKTAEPEPSEEKSFSLPIKPYIRNLALRGLKFASRTPGEGNDIEADLVILRIFVEGSAIPLRLEGVYQGVPVEIAGSLGRIEDWHGNRSTPITIQGSLGEAAVAVDGTAGPLLPEPNARLEISLAADDLATLGTAAGIALPRLHDLDFSLTAVAENGRLAAEDVRLQLDDPATSVELNGDVRGLGRSAGGAFEIEQIRLDLEARSQQLQSLAETFGVQLPGAVPAAFSLTAAAAGSLDRLSLENLQATIADDGLEATVSAQATNLFQGSGVQLQLMAAIRDTGLLGRYTGTDVPALGKLNLEGQVVSAGETYRLDSLAVQLNGEVVQARLNSTVEDLLALAAVGENPANYGTAGIAADFALKAQAVAAIARQAGVEIPELGAVEMEGQLASSENSLMLESLQATLIGELLSADLRGTVENLPALAWVGSNPENFGAAGIDALVELQAPSIADLARLAGRELPEIGSLDLAGHLVSSGQSLQLETLDGNLAYQDVEARVTMTADDLIALTGVRAVIDAELDSLASLAELAAAELPQSGPWQLHLEATSDAPRTDPVALSAELQGEEITAEVEAELADVKRPRTFAAQVAVHGESITRIADLLGRKLPEDRPFSITGTAVGKPGEYRLDGFLLEAGESSMTADLVYVMPPVAEEGRKNLSGRMALRNFDFPAWMAAQGRQDDPDKETSGSRETRMAEAPAGNQTADKRIFSDEPIALGVLREYDLALDLVIEDVTVQEEVILDGTIGVSLDRRLLQVSPFTLEQSNGGTGDGKLSLDARSAEAELAVDLEFEDFVSPRFGGLFDLNVDLEGEGESLAELMASLDGHFVADLENVVLVKSFMSQFGAGLLSNLNPLDSDTTTLECAIVRVEVDDGIADFEKKIAAQTTEVTWLGGGEINLKTEEIDVGIAPKARKILSSMTNVGLASLVHIGGTLADPSIGIDMADVAKKYASYTAFVATGGLSFLAQKLLDNRTANIDQCERILKDFEEK